MLITLGIIGVVAAMTIPNLIANVRSHQYRSAFKKAVSTLSQAARMSEAQYDFDYAGINSTCVNPATDHPEEVMSICAIMNGTLSGATYLGAAGDIDIKRANSVEKYSITTSSSTFAGSPKLASLSHANVFVLGDGTWVVIHSELGKDSCTLSIGTTLKDSFQNNEEMNACIGFIDVNGGALPNKEVSCSSGTNSLTSNNCIVRNDAQHMTDIYPIRIHDGIVEPATAAARYVLKTAK